MFVGTVLFTFLAIGTVSGQLLLGEKKCTWGPAYWCSDLSSAKECGAVSHCMTTSWKNDPAPDVEADECCTKCEAFVDRLRNYASLSENDTVTILNSACDAVPDVQLRQQCKDGVQTYVKEVMDMLIQKMDPKKICSLIRLCKKSQKPAQSSLPTFARVQLHRTESAVKVVKDSESCEVCKLSVLEAKNYISNADNQKQITKFLVEEVCRSNAECAALVNTYAPQLFQILVAELDGDRICPLFGLCGQSQHVLAPVFRQIIDVITFKHSSNSACDICKSSFAEVKAYVDNNRAAIVASLKNLCQYCPSKDQCVADIDNYIQQVFSAIDSFLANSDENCKKIGFCANKSAVSSTKQTTVKKLGGVKCTICEFVMKELDHLLDGNRTEAAIFAAIDKICLILPKTVSGECSAFIDGYGKLIIELLIKEMEPAQICTALGLCDSKVDAKPKADHDTTLKYSPLLLRGEPMQTKKMVSAKISPQCVLCEFVMSKLETLLAKNATEQEIVHGLEKVCSIMPSSMRDECDKMVEEYAPAIIKILASEMRPTIVCGLLGLCPVKNVMPASSEFCVACETAMMYVDSLLKENATEEEIEHLLLKVCNFLPEAVRGECNMVVMLYTPEIVQYLVNKMSPQQICSELKLCSGKKVHKKMPMVALAKAILKSKPMVGVDSTKCMYGPAYWCASRYNAKKCQMTEHCQKHFWGKKTKLE